VCVYTYTSLFNPNNSTDNGWDVGRKY